MCVCVFQQVFALHCLHRPNVILYSSFLGLHKLIRVQKSHSLYVLLFWRLQLSKDQMKKAA